MTAWIDEDQLLMRRPTLLELPPMPNPGEGYGIRVYREGDDAALTRVLCRSFEEIGWTLGKVQSELVDAPDVETIYVATHKDIPVATASARFLPDKFPNSGYLHWVGVEPDHRGGGLGRLVTLAVMHYFYRAGYRDTVLETDDFRIPAITLYLSLGYVPVYHHPSHQARWEALRTSLRG